MPPALTVSVIIPCFNQGRFLAEAVASVQRQTVADWECIIVNDGSTDETPRVAAELVRADPRIRVIGGPDRGLSASRNRGLADAKGRFIQFLDADDLIEPEKLELQLAALAGAAPPAVAYCKTVRFFDRPEMGEPPDMPTLMIDAANPALDVARRWQIEGDVPCHAFLFDATLFSQRGIRFDETLDTHGDWDCWVELFRLRPSIVYQDRVLARYRFHENSMCRDRAAVRRGGLLAIRKQLERSRGDNAMERALRDRIELVYGWKRAYAFGEEVARSGALPREKLLRRSPLAWRLLRMASLSRGAFSYAASFLASSEESRVERRWLAGELFGYNMESIKLAQAKEKSAKSHSG